MPYAFTFDASACSGCKACQVACKDKNHLPAGVLWRRVYEITGGSWQRLGDAWVSDVFAYNLSIACNHCVHPKCAGVCPTDAFVVREDGIVYIDESKCIGCGYCNWACPYAAPRYNPELGKMAKCNFCFDNIDAGLPPACVAACPMRVLDFVEVDSPQLPVDSHRLWQTPASQHPYPLPNFSRTEPHLAIKPHTGMLTGLEKVVSNREEIRPLEGKSKVRRLWSPKSPDFGELPLVAFTLLGQMAAGMAVLSLFSGPLSSHILIALGVSIGLAGLASFLHLGSPGNAWRGIVHLKKSWLSREIMAFALFGGSWLLALALPGMGKGPLALCGMGFVYSMAQVYRLRSIPAWNSNRTLLAFAGSALLLGGLALRILDYFTDIATIRNLLLWIPIPYLFTMLSFPLSFTVADRAHQTACKLRLGLIGWGLLGLLVTGLAQDSVGKWIAIPIFVVLLVEEGIGRWLFYEHLNKRNL